MKLLFCANCMTTFNLTTEKKLCKCRKSGGRVEDQVAHIWGEYAVILKFDQDTFASAIQNQAASGDGVRFKAAVLSKTHSRVRHSSKPELLTLPERFAFPCAATLKTRKLYCHSQAFGVDKHGHLFIKRIWPLAEVSDMRHRNFIVRKSKGLSAYLHSSCSIPFYDEDLSLNNEFEQIVEITTR